MVQLALAWSQHANIAFRVDLKNRVIQGRLIKPLREGNRPAAKTLSTEVFQQQGLQLGSSSSLCRTCSPVETDIRL
jgi:hypothetical protein